MSAITISDPREPEPDRGRDRPEPPRRGRITPLIERALAPAHVLTLVRRLQPAAVASLVEDLLGPAARSEH